MPFRSKRQQRAMFAGAIPGLDKEDARRWAHETKNIKDLPERAPAEKGKPTLRSKKAAELLQKRAREESAHPTRHAVLAGLAGAIHPAAAAAAGAVTGNTLGDRAGRAVVSGMGAQVGRLGGGMAAGLLALNALGPEASRAGVLLPIYAGMIAGGAAGAIGGARLGSYLAGDPEDPDSARAKKAALGASVEALEDDLVGVFKVAALGIASGISSNVGRLKGMMTSHAMKAPGYAASTQAIRPSKNIVSAINSMKPH